MNCPENVYPITDINVWQPKVSKRPPSGWIPVMKTVSQRHEADMNSGSYKKTGPLRISQKLILLVKREKGKQPLTDIAVMFSDNARDGRPGEKPPKTHTTLSKNIHGTSCDLNMSTLGRSIFLLYSRTAGVPIMDLQVIFTDKGEKEPDRYLRIDRTVSGAWEADLNAGGEYGGEHGRHIFLAFRYCPQTSVFIDLFRLNRKGFDVMQWVEVKTANGWQQRLMVVQDGSVMMFEGPFSSQLNFLSENYFYDMEWLKVQKESLDIRGGKVRAVEDVIHVDSNPDPTPTFQIKPIDKESFNPLLEILQSIMAGKHDFEQLTLDEEQENIEEQQEESGGSLAPITNISFQHEKCHKMPPGWKLVRESVSGKSGCVAHGRSQHYYIAVQRDPTLPPLRNIKVLFNDRDEYGNVGEHCPAGYKRIRKCFCKQHPADLNPNKGNRLIARDSYMAVSYVGGVADTPLTEIAIVTKEEEVPEGWEVITKTSSGRWDADLGTGGSENRSLFLAFKRQPLPKPKEEPVIEEETPDLTFKEKVDVFKKRFMEFYHDHAKFRAYLGGLAGMTIVSIYCWLFSVLVLPFILLSAFLGSQKIVRKKRKRMFKEHKKFKEVGLSLYEPPQLTTHPGNLFASPLVIKQEETQTEEERVVERERVEKEKKEERKRQAGEQKELGASSLMISRQSSVVLVNAKAEKCEWLNDILYKFWRTSAQGLVSSSLGMTRDIIDMVMVNLQELPLMRGVSVQLKSVQVGDHAPFLVSMSALQTVGCDDMILDTELKWNSNLSISGVLKKLALPVPFTISDIDLHARAKVGIKIDRGDIFKSLLGITLTQECSPDFKVAAVTKIPGFDQIIHVIVKAVVSMLLLWPTYMAFRLDGSYADFFEESEETLQRPFAEIALLRGDINRGKLPLGWNMVKALHAPWVTPLGKGGDNLFYICYRRATDEEMAQEHFEPVTALKFADARRTRQNLLSNTLFGLSGNLAGKSDPLFLAVDSNDYAAPIVEIAVAEGNVKPKDNRWHPVMHVTQGMNSVEPYRVRGSSLYFRYGERIEGKEKFDKFEK